MSVNKITSAPTDNELIGKVNEIIDNLGGGGGGSSTLSGLTDVTITSVTNGQVLTYDSSNSKWINANSSGGGSSRNIGEIVTSSVPLSDPKLHLLDGSLLTSTDYPEFVTAIDNVYNSSPGISATYNVTTVGSLTGNNGVYSGFSSSKYLKTTVSFKPGTSNWEICIGFITPSTLQNNDSSVFCKYLNNGYYGFRINFGSYGIYYLVSADQNNNLVFAEVGDTTLQPNTDYLLKMSFNGNRYLMQLSTDDGQTWTTDKEVVSSTPMYDWTADTTLGNFVGVTDKYMRGSININKAYIKINGDYVWKGATIIPAGFIEESSWQGEVTAYGSCGKFVYDSTNHTVRLPKIDCVLKGTTDAEQIGTISQYLYSTGTNALNTAQTLYYIVVK